MRTEPPPASTLPAPSGPPPTCSDVGDPGPSPHAASPHASPHLPRPRESCLHSPPFFLSLCLSVLVSSRPAHSGCTSFPSSCSS